MNNFPANVLVIALVMINLAAGIGLAVPLAKQMRTISGDGLLNVEQAYQFGIPDFVPWPFNTVLGFCIALAAGTIILKTAFTTGLTALITWKD